MGETLSDQQFVEQRLDQDYVRQTAALIADALHHGTPLGVNWQPGDGTSYSLVFVPITPLRHAPARVKDGIPWEAECRFGASGPGAAMVAWLEHGAVGLDLSCPGFAGGYLAPLYGTTPGSGYALAYLFNLVGEAFQRLRGEPVAAPDFRLVEALPYVCEECGADDPAGHSSTCSRYRGPSAEAGVEDRIMGDPADE